MIGIAVLVAAMSFRSVDRFNIDVRINNYIGDQVLHADHTYHNVLGQEYSVSMCKYYISNIVLTASNGYSYRVPESYYLIDLDDAGSQLLHISDIPSGVYDRFSFMIGVDSLHNCSGAQSGALDPVKGMFWAWNTGYVFLKLEGKAPQSKSPGNTYEFHIGGYMGEGNNIRQVSLKLSSPISSANRTLSLKADLGKMLNSPVAIDFSKLSSVTDPRQGQVLANNYAGMFSISAATDEK